MLFFTKNTSTYLPRCKFIFLGQCMGRLKFAMFQPFLSIHLLQTRRRTKHSVSLLILRSQHTYTARSHSWELEQGTVLEQMRSTPHLSRHYILFTLLFKSFSSYLPLSFFWLKPCNTFMLYDQNQNPEALVGNCMWH